MMRRRGFTLIELMVAMAILLILILMAFASFSFATALSRSNQNREAVLEDMTTVLDQVAKELRQTATVEIGHGIRYPVPNSTRDVAAISSVDPPLASDEYYSFGDNNPDAVDDVDHPCLTFFVLDDAGETHRISYTLGAPTNTSTGEYKGLARRYWTSQAYEPCQVLYGNEYWSDVDGDGIRDSGEAWAGGVRNLPMASQAVTNFVVTRPSWSDNVIQIVIEAMVKDAAGNPGKVTRMAQVTLRQ